MRKRMKTYYFAIRNKNDAFAACIDVKLHQLLFPPSVLYVPAYHVVAGVAVEYDRDR